MRPLALLLALTAALLVGDRAFAHAQLVSTEPAASAVVTDAPTKTVLTFSEPVRVLATRWFLADGERPVEVSARAKGAELEVPVPAGIGTGTHVLSWRVVSADGHPVGGSLVFSVGAPTEVTIDTSSSGTARAAAIARGLLTLALVLGVGGAVFARLVDRGAGPAPRSLGLARWAALAVVPASAGALGLHGLDMLGASVATLPDPDPWMAALSSPFAATAAASTLAGVAAAFALRGGGASLAALAWGLAAVSFALFGHAATAPPRWLTAPAVAVHAAAFLFWVGALPGIAERAAQADSSLTATLHRFSSLAILLVAGLVASGAALAIVQLARPAALIETAYGRLLTAKLALVAVLLLLAGLNRLWLAPAVAHGEARAPTRLCRSVVTEIALSVLVLTLASGFRLTPPPRALEAAAPTEVIVHLHGRSVMAELALNPGRQGPNDVEIVLVGADYRPLEPLEVSLAFSDETRGVEPIRLEAGRDGPLWRAGPVHLPHGGDWTVSLDVLVDDFTKETLETIATMSATR